MPFWPIQRRNHAKGKKIKEKKIEEHREKFVRNTKHGKIPRTNKECTITILLDNLNNSPNPRNMVKPTSSYHPA